MPCLLVLRSAGMRDFSGINGAWMEECHDAYKCCAFADRHRDPGAVTVRLRSHQIVAQATAQAGGALGRRLASPARGKNASALARPNRHF
jgi:hypothetical protein